VFELFKVHVDKTSDLHYQSVAIKLFLSVSIKYFYPYPRHYARVPYELMYLDKTLGKTSNEYDYFASTRGPMQHSKR